MVIFNSYVKLPDGKWGFNLIWLVVLTPLKNMKVSWDYYSQYMEN